MMEEIKSMVPDGLKRMIAESTDADLPATSSSLLGLFVPMPQFQMIVKELGDPGRGLCGKDEDRALHFKEEGNNSYSQGDYSKALSSYSQALRLAPPTATTHDGKHLLPALYLNRATVLHRIGLLMECLRDCNRALQISPAYAKAWFRRGKANAALGHYEAASCDFEIAHIMETSLGGKKQIESEMKMVPKHLNDTPTSPAHKEMIDDQISDELQGIKLRLVMDRHKGRGIASMHDIPPSSLVHVEEPFAAIILKPCRNTHCNYCFNELPADSVPCTSCSIAVYCSQHCQMQARGENLSKNTTEIRILQNVPCNLKKHIAGVTIGDSYEEGLKHFYEHRHECLGASWPAVLPPHVVLAGRIIVKSLMYKSDSINSLDICHSYTDLHPEMKLELHVYSLILLCCLQYSCQVELPVSTTSMSQTVTLLCQIRVNSVAIVRMKFADPWDLPHHDKKISSSGGTSISTIEQVKVGQAIYLSGSYFNHSCQPNVHAYFLSRTLLIRTTEFVAAGNHLEISYGPQVGQWRRNDRRKFLKEAYSFDCQCSGCSVINASDLLLNAFHCIHKDCTGVVLDTCETYSREHNMKHILSEKLRKLEPYVEVKFFLKRWTGELNSKHEVEKLKNEEMAQDASEECNISLLLGAGYCLKCGRFCDLDSSSDLVNTALSNINRLTDGIGAKQISSDLVFSALSSLGLLRSRRHAYSKCIAEVEDNIAQAFCLVGELQSAVDHCKVSIEILEKLYGLDHVVMGFELVKLLSIQISAGDCAASRNMSRIGMIFGKYYGSHVQMIFPFLPSLERESTLICV